MTKIGVAVHSQLIGDAIAMALRGRGFDVLSILEPVYQSKQLCETHLLIIDELILIQTCWLNRIANNKPYHGKLILIGADFSQQEVRTMISDGVSGLVSIEDDFGSLVTAVKQVQLGGHFLSQRILQGVMANGKGARAGIHAYCNAKLSRMELSVLQSICRDETVKESAAYIGVSGRTIERYRNRLLNKTKSKTVAGLVLFAIKNGFSTLSDSIITSVTRQSQSRLNSSG